MMRNVLRSSTLLSNMGFEKKGREPYTLINNMNMDHEELRWFEKIWDLYYTEDIVWIDLKDLKMGVSRYLGKPDASIVVATGGVEVYEPIGSERIFVFQSPNHFNLPYHVNDTTKTFLFASKITIDILRKPERYHRKELKRLKRFIEKLESESKIKVVEGDAGPSGLSYLRLALIYKLIESQGHEPEIIIALASKTVRNSFVSTANTPGQVYLREMKIGKIKTRPIFLAESHIRRATEALGPEKEELDEKVKYPPFPRSLSTCTDERLKEMLIFRGIDGDTFQEYLDWYNRIMEKRDERIRLDAELINKYNQKFS